MVGYGTTPSRHSKFVPVAIITDTGSRQRRNFPGHVDARSWYDDGGGGSGQQRIFTGHINARPWYAMAAAAFLPPATVGVPQGDPLNAFAALDNASSVETPDRHGDGLRTVVGIAAADAESIKALLNKSFDEFLAQTLHQRLLLSASRAYLTLGLGWSIGSCPIFTRNITGTRHAQISNSRQSANRRYLPVGLFARMSTCSKLRQKRHLAWQFATSLASLLWHRSRNRVLPAC